MPISRTFKVRFATLDCASMRSATVFFLGPCSKSASLRPEPDAKILAHGVPECGRDSNSVSQRKFGPVALIRILVRDVCPPGRFGKLAIFNLFGVVVPGYGLFPLHG